MVITCGEGTRWAIDALIGHTVQGEDVGYGYTADEQFSAPYGDGGGMETQTLLYYEDLHEPMPEPCGIVGPEPDGSYNRHGSFCPR